MNIRYKILKSLLEHLYQDYDYKVRIAFDPIEFPHRYSRPEDIEVSAFIASCFAYGQVSVFKGVLEKVFAICGQSPYDFVASFRPDREGRLLSEVRYRFNTPRDIIALFYALSVLVSTSGGIKNAFLQSYGGESTLIPSQNTFVERLLSIDTKDVYGSDIKPLGYRQFFPRPQDGSPCKRLNLFLRWMVRDRDVDFGLWREIPKNRLIIPLDTHIARIGRCLGLTNRTSVDLKMAIEITGCLKELDPEDPIKYDFALCHQGISRVCATERCKDCRVGLKNLKPKL